MSVWYINDFDNPDYSYDFVPHGSQFTIVKKVVGLIPAYNPPTWVFVNNNTIKIAQMGNMLPGTSLPNISTGTMVVEPPQITFVNNHFVNSNGGTVVTVDKNSAPAAAGQVQSKTLYVVFENYVLLSRGNVITAEVVFDMPTASGGTPADVWAVALNFKTGDQDDNETPGSTDQKVGVTCQFSGGGNVRFHGTDYPNMTDSGTYAGFAASRTKFSLVVELEITNGANGQTASGSATLTYGIVVHSGTLTIPPNFDPGAITAVGVAVVSAVNHFDYVRARLHSFTLSAPPSQPLLKP